MENKKQGIELISLERIISHPLLCAINCITQNYVGRMIISSKHDKPPGFYVWKEKICWCMEHRETGRKDLVLYEEKNWFYTDGRKSVVTPWFVIAIFLEDHKDWSFTEDPPLVLETSILNIVCEVNLTTRLPGQNWKIQGLYGESQYNDWGQWKSGIGSIRELVPFRELRSICYAEGKLAHRSP